LPRPRYDAITRSPDAADVLVPSILSDEEMIAITAALMRGDTRPETPVLLRAVLARSPDDGRALFLLGAEQASLGLFEDARRHFARAVEL
jgi:Flp pilus assembly protein TadD